MRQMMKRASGAIRRTFAEKPSLYAYKEQRLATSPGVGNYAFIPLFSLPLESVGGPGIGVYKNWGANAPQLYYGQEQRIDGLEGITATGMQSTPLIDMNEYLSSLQEKAAAQFESAA